MTIPLRTLFNDMVAQYVKENEYCPPLFRKSTTPILRITRPNYEDFYMLEYEFKIHFSASETDMALGKEIDLSTVRTKYYDDIRLTNNEETLSFIVAQPGDVVKFGSEPCQITDEIVIYRSETNPKQIFMMEAHSFAKSHRILSTFKSNAPLAKNLNIIPFKPKTVTP